MDLRARIEAAQKRRDATSAALSEDDRAEILAREELSRIEAQAEENERQRRDLEIARRLDAAREAHPGERIEAVVLTGAPDSYLVMHSGKAFADWQTSIHRAASGAKVDPIERDRKLALAVIIDWNGATGDALGHELVTHLRTNPAQVTPIVNAASKLAGLFAEERKR